MILQELYDRLTNDPQKKRFEILFQSCLQNYQSEISNSEKNYVLQGEKPDTTCRDFVHASVRDMEQLKQEANRIRSVFYKLLSSTLGLCTSPQSKESGLFRNSRRKILGEQYLTAQEQMDDIMSSIKHIKDTIGHILTFQQFSIKQLKMFYLKEWNKAVSNYKSFDVALNPEPIEAGVSFLKEIREKAGCFRRCANAVGEFRRLQQSVYVQFCSRALLFRHSEPLFAIRSRRGRQKKQVRSPLRPLLIENTSLQLDICNVFSDLFRGSRLWEKKLQQVYRRSSERLPVYMPVGDSRLSRNRLSVLDSDGWSDIQRTITRVDESPFAQLPRPPVCPVFDGASRYRSYPPGSPEAVAFAARAKWIRCLSIDKSDSMDLAVPEILHHRLAVVVVPDDRIIPEAVHMTDARYCSSHHPNKITQSCLVVRASNCTVLSIFVTDECLPAVAEVARDVRTSRPVFEKHYPLNKKKIDGCRDGAWGIARSERYRGKNWLDGIQIFSSAGRYAPKIDGVYVRPYKRSRDIQKDEVKQVYSMYAGIQAVEKKISPSMYRRRMHVGKDAPRAFEELPLEWIGATAVGFSAGFSVNTHHDSTRRGICETVLWAGQGHDVGFAITETRPWLVFDIGTRPCIMMFMGTDEHGTMVSTDPRRDTFYGAVLMSKMRATSTTPQIQKSIRRYKQALKQNKNLDNLAC